MVTAADSSSDCTEAGVRDARMAFNEAIQRDDLDAIAAILDEDVVLVTGTDSDLYVGNERQVRLWAADVGSTDRIIYVRRPSEISITDAYRMAMEMGEWTGTASAGAEIGGEYAAKWRCADAGWRLEAEVFMTTRCSGRLCGR